MTIRERWRRIESKPWAPYVGVAMFIALWIGAWYTLRELGWIRRMFDFMTYPGGTR